MLVRKKILLATCIKTGVLLTLFLLTGCVTLYKPNVVYSPMLKQKGELNVSGSFGLSGSGLFNAQAAYAFGDHMGVMLNGMYHRRTLRGADSSVDRLNILFAETGVGYFSPFAENKMLFQVYGGGGYGNAIDILESKSDRPQINANYMNYFVQPGIAYTGTHVELGFDARFNFVNMYRVHAYLYNRFEWWNTDFRFYNDTSLRFAIVEPCLTLKAGGPRLKSCFQLGLTVPVIRPENYFSINTTSLLGFTLIKLSAGVQYTFK